MNNDRDTVRDTDVTDESMRDRNRAGESTQGDRGTRTMQRSRTERGEIDNSNPEIDDDAIIDEASRSDIGAGE